MNEHQTCTCPTAHGNDFPKVTDHYCVNFIPTGWRLEYTSLSQKDSERVLYLTGQCLRCGGQDLQCGVSIPNELAGDALLAYIYQEMTRYRPFERRYDDGTYSAGLSQRARWYMGQDDLTLNQRNAQFLLLFQEKDWGTVEEWINRCRVEEAYTTPHRDRKSTLLYAVLERARATGDLKEIEPILDYYLPNEEEPLSPKEDSYLTNYAFSAEAKVSFGCEGIFVDKQHPDPGLGEQGDDCGPNQLGKAQISHRHRRGEKTVPVVVRVLQPPLPGAKHTQKGRQEKHRGEQGVLAPQTVPGVAQHRKVSQIVEGP